MQPFGNSCVLIDESISNKALTTEKINGEDPASMIVGEKGEL
jgi:hypothetical protein